MRELPPRPNLDQLRRQARELRRAAATPMTLAAAQLALAREHGFPSWARLKAEVERRRAADPASYAIRPVRSLEELASVFDLVGGLSKPAITREDRRYRELAGRFPEDRTLMLVVENRGRVVGGMLAMRRGSGVTPRAAGLARGLPVDGLTERLLRAFEAAALRLGASEVFEGAVGDARALYERLGYRGRNPMRRSLLPLPGRAREALLRKLGS
jgi:hypothetical protein